MTHPSIRFHALPAARLLLAAVLSGWIAGPACAVEEEEIVEEETVEAPAPTSAAKAPAAEPAEEPVEAESAEPAAAPAAAPAPAAPKPAVEPNPVTLNPAGEPAESAEVAEPEATAEGEAEEGMELADDEAAPVEAAEPVVAAEVVAPVAAPVVTAPPAEEEAIEPEPAIVDAAPVEEPAVTALPVIAPEPARPMPVWNARAQEAAFTDYLRAGIPVNPLKGPLFAARVVGTTDSFRSGSVQREQMFVTGSHATGRVFVVYRAIRGARLARYIGLVSMLKPAGADRTGAVALRAVDMIQPGDGLVALDDARKEFDGERARATRESEQAGETAGRVVCFHEDREIQTMPDDVLLVNRGSRDGITLAWVCELPEQGSDRVAAYGRVVRLAPDACLVKVLKSYEPVRAGVTARLASRPASDRARAGRGR